MLRALRSCSRLYMIGRPEASLLPAMLYAMSLELQDVLTCRSELLIDADLTFWLKSRNPGDVGYDRCWLRNAGPSLLFILASAIELLTMTPAICVKFCSFRATIRVRDSRTRNLTA